jgi:hypothetical protein
MAGGLDGREHPARARDGVALAHLGIGAVLEVAAALDRIGLADSERPRARCGPQPTTVAPVAAFTAFTAGEWSRWVCDTTMWLTVSPRTASRSAAMCAGESGPGSMMATVPVPTM